MSLTELKTLNNYLNDALVKKWICESQSSANMFILFISKKSDELHLCINYYKLNIIIIKNCYSLSLANKLLNQLNSSSREKLWKTEIVNSWSKILKTLLIWSSLWALTVSQLSLKQLLNCVGAAGLKLTPGLQEPVAAKSVKINQPPPQFLIKLLGKTGDQQVSAGLAYRPKSVQGTSTLLMLQLKMHAAAARILTKNFHQTNSAPSSEPRSWPILNLQV